MRVAAKEKQEKKPGKRGDHFWLIIVFGVIVVSAASWFLGSFVANRIVGGHNRPPVVDTNGNPVGTDDQSRADAIQPVEDRPEITVESSRSDSTRKEEEKSDEEKQKTEEQPATTSVTVESSTNEAAPPPKKSGEDTLFDSETDTTQPKKTEETKPSGDTSLYRLQLGNFTDRENAQRVKQEIENEFKIPVYIREVKGDTGSSFSVQGGVFTDRANAEKMARELQLKGYRTYISKDEKK